MTFFFPADLWYAAVCGSCSCHAQLVWFPPGRQGAFVGLGSPVSPAVLTVPSDFTRWPANTRIAAVIPWILLECCSSAMHTLLVVLLELGAGINTAVLLKLK